jgi:hypothetical protein
MLEVAYAGAGVAIALTWLGIWAGLLHVVGIAPMRRTVEEQSSKRARLKRLGRFTYVVTFGVLGFGVAFGLAMITVDLFSHRSHGWLSEVLKFSLYAVLFGLFQGFRSWGSAFRDPVPFPPNYPSAK